MKANCEKCIHKKVCTDKYFTDIGVYPEYPTPCEHFIEEPDIKEFVKRLAKILLNSNYGKKFIYADTDSIICEEYYDPDSYLYREVAR